MTVVRFVTCLSTVCPVSPCSYQPGQVIAGPIKQWWRLPAAVVDHPTSRRRASAAIIGYSIDSRMESRLAVNGGMVPFLRR